MQVHFVTDVQHPINIAVADVQHFMQFYKALCILKRKQLFSILCFKYFYFTFFTIFVYWYEI